MDSPPGSDRDFWRDVVTTGRQVAVPGWTVPVNAPPGTAEYGVALAAEPPEAELLAAHAAVLEMLGGEAGGLTGLVPDGHTGDPLPCPLPAGGSWLDRRERAGRVAAEVAAHAHAYEAGWGPAPETVLGAGRGELPEGVALWVSAAGPELRLRYRTDVFDADQVARIGGYHARALELMAAAPDAEPVPSDLLSAEERDLQLNGLAGPARELPDRRFHELFEEQVRRTPGAVAAAHAGVSWTYEELNRRANRIGRALLARGLSGEDVVAVVTERNLDWAASVLAVFKAGGTYLPIEPHFPAERIATTLRRAGCDLVLAERGGSATLDGALRSRPGVRRLLLDEIYAEEHEDGDLGVAVGPDDRAYIYFTSGSTGEPKGAMCEHAGMLNHLYAKIEDLGVTADRTVAQIAPQCFDISLWQLVSALLVGGRTLIVEQDVILDVERFVDLVAREVTVMQVVPSYLEVVLSHLEGRPGGLGGLRCVSATGEALKRELAERWFAAFPHITLVNAYGLTETCDDTNHEVMDRAPERDRVPLGRPIRNVHAYVVDEDLRLVPLGAPGELVFSGLCVGRGYVNDPGRTAAAFVDDPYRPGRRLYRSGDFGRWLPDGRLEFLGRRDAQVKIRGFRVEIGEIENRLLTFAGVRDAAVVVAGTPDGGKTLVAFYSSVTDPPPGGPRDHLSAALPEYMVPAHFHRLETLPLTDNGKIDKKGLTALAETLVLGGPETVEPLTTPTERRVAAAWARALGVAPEKVGRSSHFFDSGGTSLSAVQLVVGLDRAVSLKTVTRHPVLADLAAFIDGGRTGSAGLLQPLVTVDEPAAALVCLPHAGGNAVNFRPLAAALAGSGLAVHGVELPGHDLGARREPFASAEQVAKTVTAEIVQRGLGPVLLYGHSSGAALAVLVARLLEEQGHDLRAVLVGAQVVGDAASRRRFVAELAGLDDLEITARLSGEDAYTELSGVEEGRAALVGAAYRHDVGEASGFFVDALENPPASRLATPLTVVVGGADPATAGHERDLGGWSLLARTVRVRELPGAGHHFPRTHPAETAVVVRAVAERRTNGKERL